MVLCGDPGEEVIHDVRSEHTGARAVRAWGCFTSCQPALHVSFGWRSCREASGERHTVS